MARKVRITPKQKTARRKNIAVARKSKKRSTATKDVVSKVKSKYSKEYKSAGKAGKMSSNKRAQLALLIKGMK